jgi:hypothetical protein
MNFIYRKGLIDIVRGNINYLTESISIGLVNLTVLNSASPSDSSVDSYTFISEKFLVDKSYSIIDNKLYFKTSPIKFGLPVLTDVSSNYIAGVIIYHTESGTPLFCYTLENQYYISQADFTLKFPLNSIAYLLSPPIDFNNYIIKRHRANATIEYLEDIDLKQILREIKREPPFFLTSSAVSEGKLHFLNRYPFLYEYYLKEIEIDDDTFRSINYFHNWREIYNTFGDTVLFPCSVYGEGKIYSYEPKLIYLQNVVADISFIDVPELSFRGNKLVDIKDNLLEAEIYEAQVIAGVAETYTLLGTTINKEISISPQKLLNYKWKARYVFNYKQVAIGGTEEKQIVSAFCKPNILIDFNNV